MLGILCKVNKLIDRHDWTSKVIHTTFSRPQNISRTAARVLAIVVRAFSNVKADRAAEVHEVRPCDGGTDNLARLADDLLGIPGRTLVSVSSLVKDTVGFCFFVEEGGKELDPFEAPLDGRLTVLPDNHVVLVERQVCEAVREGHDALQLRSSRGIRSWIDDRDGPVVNHLVETRRADEAGKPEPGFNFGTQAQQLEEGNHGGGRQADTILERHR